MDSCIHCGSTEGYYTKNQYSGTGIFRFNFDGSEAENGDMYDCLNTTISKYAYCSSCNKRLFKTEDVF